MAERETGLWLDPDTDLKCLSNGSERKTATQESSLSSDFTFNHQLPEYQNQSQRL